MIKIMITVFSTSLFFLPLSLAQEGPETSISEQQLLDDAAEGAQDYLDRVLKVNQMTGTLTLIGYYFTENGKVGVCGMVTNLKWVNENGSVKRSGIKLLHFLSHGKKYRGTGAWWNLGNYMGRRIISESCGNDLGNINSI